MANEATVAVSLKFAKGTIGSMTVASGNVLRDVAASTGGIKNVQAVGTAAEALLLGDNVATGALVIAHNADSTNYIEWFGQATPADAATIRLIAGDWALFRIGGSVPTVKANTASCNLEYWLIPA